MCDPTCKKYPRSATTVLQVMILVDNGVELNTVEAGTLGTVTTSASLYDTNVAAENGCDPAGCVAALTRVSREALVQVRRL